MSFLYEKQTRKYMIFLACMGMILFMLAFLQYEIQGKKMNQLLLTQNEALVSALLENGVPEKVIIATYQKPEVTQAGKTLTYQLGITGERADKYVLYMKQNAAGYVNHSTLIMFGGCSLFFFLLIGGTAYFFSKREQLYQQAAKRIERFSAGDFSQHLPRNEEGTLYKVFLATDRLAMSLRSRQEQEHQGREFMKETISDISHQLKTPLSALHMYNEIVAQEPENVATVVRFTDKSAQALTRMDQLIQSLLKVTRIDAGSITFSPGKIKVCELVKQSVVDLETRAQQENKKIIVEGNEESEVSCDALWTSEAIGNLVKNALDHTDRDGIITIFWEQSAAMLRLFVKDNGKGIPEEDIHHIFKRFYRGKKENDQPGVGLGLPLAKSIIEGQGGMLSVQSVLGEGSIFTISFLTEL